MGKIAAIRRIRVKWLPGIIGLRLQKRGREYFASERAYPTRLVDIVSGMNSLAIWIFQKACPKKSEFKASMVCCRVAGPGGAQSGLDPQPGSMAE